VVAADIHYLLGGDKRGGPAGGKLTEASFKGVDKPTREFLPKTGVNFYLILIDDNSIIKEEVLNTLTRMNFRSAVNTITGAA